MKTFRFLFLLPLLALGHFTFAGETSANPASTSNTLHERTVKSAGVRVELPTFDRAIRALVDSAARTAAEDNPVTLPTPAVQAPDVLDTPATTATSAHHAAGQATPAQPATAAKPAAPAHRALHVAGL